MADESKQVTMTFSGFDDSADKTVMFEGPLRINKVVDSIDNLPLLDLSGFKSGDSIIVFVRNVNATSSASKGKIPYRGSFYRYDWTSTGWQQIVIGTHSHANMALLDELGNISTEGMSVGDEKILKIKKTDSTESGNANDYSLEFVDNDQLPDLPTDLEGKTLYLTVGQDGKLQWQNSLVPSQTFKVLKIAIQSSIRPTGDSTKKKIYLSKSYLEQNQATFDESIGDQILVFDNGQLIQTATASSDDGITITIADSESGHTFDDGETVTAIILRNGINGLLSAINGSFATKADLVSLSSKGTVDLGSYETASDAKRNYATFSKKGHQHPEYLRKDEYDAFDWRYADYQHTHKQYVTRNDVLAILADAVGTSGQISTDDMIAKITADLETQVNLLKENYYDKATTEAIIDTKIALSANTAAITETNSGQALSDYLLDLESQIEVAQKTDTDKVTTKEISVNLGTGNSIGGYQNGDKIPAGASLTSVLAKLVTKEQVPELKNPEIITELDQQTTASGKISVNTLNYSFQQGNAGAATSISIRTYIKKEPTDTDEYSEFAMDLSDKAFTQTVQLTPLDDTGFCYLIRIIVAYANGPLIQSNIAGKYYQVKGGTITKDIPVYCERKYMFGSLQFGLGDTAITGDTIIDAGKNLTVFQYDDNDIDDYGIQIVLSKASGAQTIVFAQPESKKTEIKSINYVQQGYDVMDQFTKTEHVAIKDDAGSLSGLSPLYTVYTLSLKQPIKSDMTFDLEMTK